MVVIVHQTEVAEEEVEKVAQVWSGGGFHLKNGHLGSMMGGMGVELDRCSCIGRIE
jgi:hypothetical protein